MYVCMYVHLGISFSHLILFVLVETVRWLKKKYKNNTVLH